ncbi:QRFP-like peptide receptor [Montipora capricornis]|uniref:QRFP-like peptide receptor n=1 Tax=Montipora capricornis TaxID=246305 RepID=UPI0035F19CAC
MNTTINGSEICSVHWNPTAYKIGATVAYCLIFVVSLVGNSCIGIIVYKTKTLRKPINIFIVNMAMSDLLVPLIDIPLQVVNLYRYSWLISGVLGNAFCKLIPFLYEVSYIVSVQTLILIAVGRFGAVVWPLHSSLISLKRCTFFILATWIVAMASMSPVLFARSLEKYEGEIFCFDQWEEAFGESLSLTDYGLAYYIVFVYTPIILLIIIYSIILIKLKLQKIPGQQSTDAEIQCNKRNTNVLKLAIAILLGVMFCKIPWSILKLMSLYGKWPCSIFPQYVETSWFLLISYCAVNPCICFAFCRNYREGLKKLLKCCSDLT